MSCEVVFPREVHSWGKGRFARFVYPESLLSLMKFSRDFEVSSVYVGRELIGLKCSSLVLRHERFQVDEEYRTRQNGVMGHFVSHWIEYSARSLRLWVDDRQNRTLHLSISLERGKFLTKELAAIEAARRNSLDGDECLG